MAKTQHNTPPGKPTPKKPREYEPPKLTKFQKLEKLILSGE